MSLSPDKTIFIERLRLRDLFHPHKVIYFDVSKPAAFLLRFCPKGKFTDIQWRLPNVSNVNGEYLEDLIYIDVAGLYKKYEAEHILHNDFVNGFWPEEKELIRIYFAKAISLKITQRMFYINYLETYRLKHNLSHLPFKVRDGLLFNYVKDYASAKSIDLSKAGRDWIETGRNMLFIFGCLFIFPLREFLSGLFNSRKFKDDVSKPFVGLWYNFNPITLDQDKRSALFLLLKSGLPWNRVMLYFENTAAACDDKMVDEMDRLGLKYIAKKRGVTQSKRVPEWSVSKDFFSTLFKRNYDLLLHLVRHLGESIEVTELFRFNATYALHYDFFKSMNIKANVGLENFSTADVPKYLALKYAGGARLCYQISNINTPNIHDRGVVSDVYFPFGPHYRKAVEESHSHVTSFLPAGYVTDYCFKSVKDKSQQLRSRLKEAGAKFVVTFFDEGFGVGRTHPTREEASRNHDFFAQLVLDHHDVAVIFKPKKIQFSPDSALVKQAIGTNRFVVLNEGRYLINTFPAEAALASDITVGLFQSGTTNLESMVAGVPTFFLDLHKLYYLPEYSFGRDQLVFDNRERLKAALSALKNGGTYFKPKEFTDLVKSKDPFQDGRAIERIGDYVRWLIEQFDAGKSREEALRFASQKYEEKWLKAINQSNHAYSLS
jgi:hypothetical protein